VLDYRGLACSIWPARTRVLVVDNVGGAICIVLMCACVCACNPAFLPLCVCIGVRVRDRQVEELQRREQVRGEGIEQGCCILVWGGIFVQKRKPPLNPVVGSHRQKQHADKS
jgi:hypothetical protein